MENNDEIKHNIIKIEKEINSCKKVMRIETIGAALSGTIAIVAAANPELGDLLLLTNILSSGFFLMSLVATNGLKREWNDEKEKEVKKLR